jgi:photosystem II stability/assembly factor-like uncharacterized protein
MYAGTATGGVWKTVNAGQSWAPLTDFIPVLSVSSLAMSPTDNNTLFVGTGEYSRGAGIFKSTDGGQTWAQLPQTATSDFYYVFALVFSPARPNNLYATTNSGVWMSPDAGNTWRPSLAGSTEEPMECSSLTVQSDQPKDILFASCSTYVFANQGSTYAIYRNLDAAGTGTWENVLTDPKMGPAALAVAPSKPTVVYAVATDADATSPFRYALLAVYRSTSRGDSRSWEVRTSNVSPDPVNPNILSYPQCPYSNNDHHGQGGYNLTIVVDPTNPDRLFAGGIDLFRSDDGGANWGYINGANQMFTQAAHVDQHILVFHPNYNGKGNQTIFAGNDGGVFRTDSALGQSATGAMAFCYPIPEAVGWTGLNNSFVATQFYHGAVYPGGTAYFGGSQDNGTSRGNDAGGPNRWAYLYGGDGGQVAVDPIDINTLFYEYINLSIIKSTNGGVTNFSATNGITEPSSDFLFINYYAIDPFDSLRLYTGGNSLWRTLDGGANWSAASSPLPVDSYGGQQYISTITISSADPNTVYFGTTSGYIYANGSALSANGKTEWSSSLPATGYVSRIVIDPRQPLTVYAVYATFRDTGILGQIFRSSDGGLTWNVLNGSGDAVFPDIPAHVLLIDPSDSSRLYVGTDIGVFVSLDGGASWMQDDDPFANAITESLVLDENGGTTSLYAFTYGRGTWRVPLPGKSGASCTYSLSTSTLDVSALGGLYSVDVDTAPGCRWVALPGSPPGQFVTSQTPIVNIQSPAAGRGPGRVYLVGSYNATGSPRTDTFFVQDQSVTVSQPNDSTGAHTTFNDELSSARQVTPLPYTDGIFNGSYTQSSSDPLHSCTGSRDFRTAWWTLNANLTGRILVTATDVNGGTGIVLSAYSFTAASQIGSELACSTIAQGSTRGQSTSIQFDVATGSTYAIEVSSPVPDGGFIAIAVSVLPEISVVPSKATVIRGTQQQFSTTVGKIPNTAVRWTLSPPIGIISPTGLYSAPADVITPTPVTIIAESLPYPVATAEGVVTVTPSIVANPSTLDFSWQPGAAPPATVKVALTAANAQNYNFTASSSATWLTIGSKAGPIPGNLSITVNPTGLYPGTYTAQVILNVSGVADSPLVIPVTFTIQENSSGPSAVTVIPASGTASGQTFTAVFSDPSSYANLQFGEININASSAVTAACDVRYDATSKALLLRTDDGTSWSSPVSPGVDGTASNSQCAIHGLPSRTIGAGKNLTIIVAVSFTQSFVGDKNVYLLAENKADSSGWQLSGAWTVNAAPSIVGVAPNWGSGSTQAFTFIYNDPTGAWDSNSYAEGSFNPVSPNSSSPPTDQNACSFWVNAPFGELGLWDDTATTYTFITFGQPQTAINSLCAINGSGSSGSQSGNIVTITLNISFSAPSDPILYIYTSESDGNSGNYWQAAGTWTVEAKPGAGATILASPASLKFSWTQGAEKPPLQNVVITTSPPGLAVTATAGVITPQGAQWLSVSINGSTLSVSVDPTGLAAGTYQGTVVLPIDGSSPLLIPVSLKVN